MSVTLDFAKMLQTHCRSLTVDQWLNLRNYPKHCWSAFSHGVVFTSNVLLLRSGGPALKKHKFILLFMGGGCALSILSTRTEDHICIDQPKIYIVLDFCLKWALPGIPWHAPECCCENGLPQDPNIKGQASLGPRTVSGQIPVWCPLNMLRPKEHVHGWRRTCVPFGASSPTSPKNRGGEARGNLMKSECQLAGAHPLLDLYRIKDPFTGPLFNLPWIWYLLHAKSLFSSCHQSILFGANGAPAV